MVRIIMKKKPTVELNVHLPSPNSSERYKETAILLQSLVWVADIFKLLEKRVSKSGA